MPACQILTHRPADPREKPMDTGWRTLPAVLIECPQGGSWRMDCEGQAPIIASSGQTFAIPAGWRHRLRTSGSRGMISTWCLLRWSDDAGLPWTIPGRPTRLGDGAADELMRLAPGSGSVAEANRLSAAWRLAALLCAASPPAPDAGDPRWRSLLAHLHEPLGRQDVAMQAGLSASRLHDWCVSRCGLAPMRLLARLRIERAQELLLCSDLPLGEVAERSGHGSPFWFSRAFRAATGRTPSAWRRSQRA